MERDCYRCRQSMEEQTAFCPACGAPQIRVRAPEPPTEYQAIPDIDLTPEQIAAVAPPPPPGFVIGSGIDWKSFIRTAAPLAALTGLITIAIWPLGFFILFPALLVLAIRTYGRRRPIPVQGSQGARMGALMGFLSFIFFSVFFLLFVLSNLTTYREFIVSKVQEAAARNPDPQAQQIVQWLTTTDGVVAMTIMFLVMALILFLVIGTGSGALAVTMGKPKNRPRP